MMTYNVCLLKSNNLDHYTLQNPNMYAIFAVDIIEENNNGKMKTWSNVDCQRHIFVKSVEFTWEYKTIEVVRSTGKAMSTRGDAGST